MDDNYINNNNNKEKIYQLYKSIFNNKFLKNNIFYFVRELNRCCVNVNNKNNKNNNNNVIMKYDDATFDWMIRSKNYQLLYDKIKKGVLLLSDIKSIKLIEFLNQEKDINILNKFYQINLKNSINNNDNCSNDSQLLVLSIKCKNVELLNIVYQDLKNKYSNDQDSLKRVIDFANCTSSSSGSGSGKIYEPNIDLLDYSLKIGDLNVIKYVINEMGFKDELDKHNLIGFSILSENRDQIVNYLLSNEIGFIKNKNIGRDSGDSLIFNLLQLNHSLFKNLFKIGLTTLMVSKIKNIDMECSPLISFNISNILIYRFNQYSPRIKFPRFLSCFQNILFTRFLNKNNDQRNLLVLKKINHLINYNNNFIINQPPSSINNNSNSSSSLEDRNINIDKFIKSYKNQSNLIKKEDLEIYEITNNNNNQNNNEKNKFFSNLKSKFTFSKPNDKCKLKEINYKDFNLKREIKRVFIFDFLMELSEYRILRGASNLIWTKMMINFAVKYKEYDHLTIFNLKFPFEDILGSVLYLIGFQHADSTLLEMVPKLYPNCKLMIDPPKESQYFDTTIIPIEQQIQFLKTVYKFGECNDEEMNQLLDHILIGGSESITIEQVDQIIEIIRIYQIQVKATTIFKNNELILNHFLNNYQFVI